ncbi:MAG: restriction endonuclease subunit S [Candidatus Humimicrobiaceae bacterium]
MRPMKESGIEWIGKIPEGWEVAPLKRNCNIFAGGTPDTQKKEYWDGDIPWIQSGKLQDCDVKECDRNITEIGYKNSSTKLIGKGVSLLAMTGATCGNVGFTTFKTCANQSVMAFVCKSSAISRFVFYSLLSQREQILLRGNGSAQGGINVQSGKSIYSSFTTTKEQQEIADFLDYKCELIDSTIEKQKTVIEKLQSYKQSVITEAATKGLDPNVKMKPSGIEWIGDIPEGWEVRKLKGLAQIISKGTTPSTMGKELVISSTIRFIKAENIKDNVVFPEPEFYIDEDTHNILARSQLKHCDILFVIAGATIGKVAIINNEFLPANTNQAISFIRLKETYNHKYIWYFLQSNYIIEQIKLLAVQSAQPNLSMQDLGSFSVPLPLLPEQKAIADYLNVKCAEVDNVINGKQKLIEKLTDYKKSLIYECVTGKKEITLNA